MFGIESVYGTGLCLAFIAGILYLLLSGFLDFLDGFFNPILFIAGFGIFCSTAWILEQFEVAQWSLIAISLTVSAFSSIGIYNFVLTPIKNAEVSMGFELNELIGTLVEVTLAVPSEGMGEVLVTVGGSRNYYSAKSYNQIEIKTGEKALVIEIEDRVFKIQKYEESM